MEKVSAVNVCLGCGFFLGNDDELFATRYIDHIFKSNTTSCSGGYSLVNVYACYHLLRCSDPNCDSLRRGPFAYYKYMVYCNGTSNPGTDFYLNASQIAELGLPHL